MTDVDERPTAHRFIGRLSAGLIGGVGLALVLVANSASDAAPVVVTVVVALVSSVAVIGGALVERRLFFLAVSAPRMPGVLR